MNEISNVGLDDVPLNGVSFIGIIRATVRNSDGSVFSSREYHNTDTLFMRSSVAGWLAGTKTTTSTHPPTQIGAGNGIGTPSASDTALWSPISGTQRNCDSITVTRAVYAQYNITYQTTDPNGPYTEVGLFDASNNLWAHASINEIKSSGQTLTIQWMVLTVPDTSNSGVLVTNIASTTITGWLTGTQTTTSNPPPTKIQLGTGTGTLAISDSTLWNATSGTSKACSFIAVSASYNVQYSSTYIASDPVGNFTEAGLFDVNGNLWMHAVLTNANKVTNRILAVLLQIAVVGN